MRKLIDNGGVVEFKKGNKEYVVAKDELGMYYILSHQGTVYKNKKLWDYEVQETTEWNKIEEFIERLLCSNLNYKAMAKE